jgi:Fic family protein
MKYTFEHIDILLRDFNTLLPMSEKDQRRLDEKFRLEFTYNSNHMEGNTLTYQDTKALLLKDIVPQGEIYTMRELKEMEAHDASFALIKAWAADPKREMNTTNLKELNKLILVKDYYKDAQTADGQPSRKQIKVGEYKSTPNSVQLSNGEIFHYADPIEVPARIQDLFDWYNTEKNNLHPIELAARFHHEFVLIHPFDDGNGRISRLMVNYILMRNGLPPIVIKSSEKQKYLNALRLADIGDMEAFIVYITEQVEWSLDISIKAAQGLSIDEPGDLDKKLELLKKDQNIDSDVSGKYSYESIEEVINRELPFIVSEIEKIRLKFDQFYNTSVYTVFLDSEFASFNKVEETIPSIIRFFKAAKNNNLIPQLLKVRLRFLDPISVNFESRILSDFSFQLLQNRVKAIVGNDYNDLLPYNNKWNEINIKKCIEAMGNDLYDKMKKI